jgi:hypothetical protein
LETEEDRFEYFNKDAFIPGKIYRIHRLDGLPVIIEFQNFGCRYNYSMTKTYPRVLISNKTQDINTPIEDITNIFVYRIANDEDVSEFKDFVDSDQRYYVNTRLRGIATVSRLFTDKMNISGELKIKSFKKAEDNTLCVSVELPTGDEITIPASDHPSVETYDEPNCSVFIEDGSELRWNKDLAAGEFYIMLNRFDEKKLILIKSIFNDKIEYASCVSRYDRNNCTYFVESVKHELMLTYATKCKFIPVNDITR